MSTVVIETRDRALRRTGQVEDFTRLEMPLRFNRVSGWTLTVDATSADARLLTEAAGIIVTRDDTVLLSGPISSPNSVLSGDRATLTVSGMDDTCWLERRLALPVPSGPPYTAAEYDDRSGPAETVMRHYVDRNLGPAATAARRLTYLTLPTDLARGATVRGRARFHTLLELLQGLALADGNIGFRIVQVGVGLEFQVYVPTDLTATAIFSLELGNLAGYDYRTAAPTANYTYVGGGGEGTARVFVEGGDPASIDEHGRIEVFRDRRDSELVADLEQQRTESLAEGAATTALSISPVDTEALAFGRDYGLGDRVTVTVDGTEIADVVREVVFDLTADGDEQLTPVVGTPGASNPRVPQLFEVMRRQARRLSNLERR